MSEQEATGEAAALMQEVAGPPKEPEQLLLGVEPTRVAVPAIPEDPAPAGAQHPSMWEQVELCDRNQVFYVRDLRGGRLQWLPARIVMESYTLPDKRPLPAQPSTSSGYYFKVENGAVIQATRLNQVLLAPKT